ncbi:hypothetical protein PF003_g5134 [Phytophthora fragariae]|nr:hypothetical protein PF003_g5134 [Phytophthora fragariae]
MLQLKSARSVPYSPPCTVHDVPRRGHLQQLGHRDGLPRPSSASQHLHCRRVVAELDQLAIATVACPHVLLSGSHSSCWCPYCTIVDSTGFTTIVKPTITVCTNCWRFWRFLLVTSSLPSARARLPRGACFFPPLSLCWWLRAAILGFFGRRRLPRFLRPPPPSSSDASGFVVVLLHSPFPPTWSRPSLPR